MNRSIILPALVTAFVALSPAGVAVAAPNPSGTGQPNQEAPDNSVPGFDSPGFANAEQHYAGEDGTPSANHTMGTPGHDKAVSQYDVAGFQYCQHHSCS
jgi:hypothetical protein